MQRQRQILKQKLNLSPLQIQFLNLLQIPIVDLDKRIEKEIEENPVIEEDDLEESENEKVYLSTNNQSNERKTDFLVDNFTGNINTLSSHLQNQLIGSEKSEDELKVVKYLINSLDENGFLRRESTSIINDYYIINDIEIGEDLLNDALKTLKDLEPAGVGAKNLRECLIIQNNKSDFDNKNRTPGMGHFHAVLESTLADFSADMVNMDMDIRGDMYWLESERDPRPYTASSYTGENYLLFRAITSAGEPDPTTGIARPGDEYKEQMLNGVYAVTEVISRFEGGQFTQNLKGVKEAFISDIDKLTNFAEVTPAIVGGNDSGSGEAPTGINRPGYSTRPANLSSLQSGQAYVDTQN